MFPSTLSFPKTGEAGIGAESMGGVSASPVLIEIGISHPSAQEPLQQHPRFSNHYVIMLQNKPMPTVQSIIITQFKLPTRKGNSSGQTWKTSTQTL